MYWLWVGLTALLFFGFILTFGTRLFSKSQTVLIVFFVLTGVGTVEILRRSLTADHSHLLFLVLLVGPALGLLGRQLVKCADDTTPGITLYRKLKAQLRLDPRVSLVLGAFLIALILTALFGTLIRSDRPDGFWLSFYSSWTASLAFFALVGIAGVAVSLHRPEKDVFRARVRILFGGREGAAMDFIAEELRKIGYFTADSRRTMVIEAHDAKTNAFRIRTIHKNVIRNFYDDQKAVDTANFNVGFDEINPAPEPYGELVSLRLAGVNKLDAPVPLRFGADEANKREFSLMIPAGQTVDVEIEWWGWFLISKEHELVPSRFTERMTVEIVYRGNTPGKSPEVAFFHAGQNEVMKLQYDVAVPMPLLIDLRPREQAYKLKFTQPQPTVVESVG